MSFFNLEAFRGFDREPTMAGAEPSKRLSPDECRAKSAECRELARLSRIETHRTMLQHMAETWERIGATLPTNGGGK